MPTPDGLKTCTSPRWARHAPVRSIRSVRVDVAITAPGASRIRPASSPVLPVRGPPTRSVTSSTGDQMRSIPTRASGVAISVVAVRSRRQRVSRARLGRSTVARRRTAQRDALRRIAHRLATPSLRRERRDQRRTVPADPPRPDRHAATAIASVVSPTSTGHGQYTRPGVPAGMRCISHPMPTSPAPTSAVRRRIILRSKGFRFGAVIAHRPWVRWRRPAGPDVPRRRWPAARPARAGTPRDGRPR